MCFGFGFCVWRPDCLPAPRTAPGTVGAPALQFSFGVDGLGLGVSVKGVGFRVLGLRFGVPGLGCGRTALKTACMPGFRFGVEGLVFGV